MKNGQKMLIIVGPTASGKSGLGVELAKRFDGEIISADSRQVYRGLDIGTGKVTKAEMKGIPHHLLDISSPKRTVTAHEFTTKAREAIAGIVARKKLPIVVGGTGFYIDSLLGRIALPDVPPQHALRKRLQKQTVTELYTLLKKEDPRRGRAMDTPSERNNKIRLIRALEIAISKSTRPSQSIKGSPLSALSVPVSVGQAQATEAGPRYDALWIGIRPPQKALERRILERLRSRIRRGMVAEGIRLHAQGLSYKRMEDLGLEYRALSRLLRGTITREEFEDELFRDIRRYAKRQLTYWKRNQDIRWYDPKQQGRITHDVASSLKMS